ncbi:hypothetical protein R6Z07F_014173 [Ovis aries]
MFLVTNSTQVPFYFILRGIPGLEVFHTWISIPFCCLYTISIAGNTTILAVISAEPSLHELMYLFLSMILCFSASEMSFEACFIQFFFLHGFSFMESSKTICRIGLAIVCHWLLAVLPALFLLKRLPFCGSPHLSHSYSLHQDMVHLVCAGTTTNNGYGCVVALLIIILDPLLIVLCYALILRHGLRIASQVERLQALSNCLSHILAVLVLYVPMVACPPAIIHVSMASVYILAPPVMNPIIYSVKTKEIRCRIFDLFAHRQLE